MKRDNERPGALRWVMLIMAVVLLGAPLRAQEQETYVLTLRPEAAAADGAAAAAQLAATYGGELVPGSGAVSEGYVVRISGARARLLGSDARVASLAPGSGVTANATWSPGLDYSYDGSGNITQVGSDVYTYDAFNRLATSKVSNVTRAYDYDVYGNRKACTENGGACEGAAPASLSTNRMTSLKYDDDGNVIGDTADCTGTHHAYTYDALNMQVKETFGTNTREYVYTADDERIAVYSNKSSWKWTIRGLDDKVLREFTSMNAPNGALATTNWTWTKDYVWRDSLLLATRQPVPGSTTGATTTYSYHLDHLGTPRLITDANGYAVGIHDYHPFGTEAAGGANEPSLSVMKFTGHERDVIDGPNDALDYMHARYYSSRWGRFLSVDPVLGEPESPQSWNRYAYVENGPVIAIDPDGRQIAQSLIITAPMPLTPAGFGSSQSVIDFVEFLAQHSWKSAWMRRQMQVMRVIGQVWSMNPDDAFVAEYGAALRRSGAFGECGSDLECGQAFFSLAYSAGGTNGKGLTGSFHFAIAALAKQGLDPKRASTALHWIKDKTGRGGANNVLFNTKNGDIVSRETGEVIGNLFDFQ